jgi:hypothetical protein
MLFIYIGGLFFFHDAKIVTGDVSQDHSFEAVEIDHLISESLFERFVKC